MRSHISPTLVVGLCVSTLVGCAAQSATRTVAHPEFNVPRCVDTESRVNEGHTALHPNEPDADEHDHGSDASIRQVSFPDATANNLRPERVEEVLPAVHVADESLERLIDTAINHNPRLIRLYQEFQAASARSNYVDKLPDPKLGANVFGKPIETAAGSQRANMSLSQTIPWLARLNAEQQRACLEAMAVRAELAAERLRVIAQIRAGWYRMYVLDRQIEIAKANQELLKSLIEVANARIATGQASQGDVLLGTLEITQLEERLLTYHRQRLGVEAEINRLVGRPASTPIRSPNKLDVGVSELSANAIHQIALNNQPEIEAAYLRAQATRWGVEVARLMRRPEFTISANYFFTDDNRPPTPVVNVGEDTWAIGVQVSLPLGRQKYDAMENEAGWKHQAAHSTVDELADRYNSLIVDLIAESNRAAETAELYRSTILPQARQTLSADQQSYSTGTVEFDRVIQDFRNLLTLELGYHKSIGDLAIANARIQQIAGQDLPFSTSPASRP